MRQQAKRWALAMPVAVKAVRLKKSMRLTFSPHRAISPY